MEVPKGLERKEQKEQLKKYWLKIPLGLITHVNMHIQEAQQNQVEHTGREQFLDTSQSN